jgi:hypothetical protein
VSIVPQRETRVVGDVLQAVRCLQGGKFWRNNTGVAVMPGRRAPVRFGEPGAADILGAFRGLPVAIECKTATGRQSAVQKRWQADWEAAGGRYIIARCVADAFAGLAVDASTPRVKPSRVIHR